MSADPSRSAPEIVSIVSQRPGVGKTTTAVNLALALAAAGRNVLLVDLDPLGDAGRYLVRGPSGAGIEQALREAIITRNMVAATEIPGVYMASPGSGLSAAEGDLTLMGDSRTRLYQALATLSALPLHFDYILIDCPAAQGLLTLNALTAADRVLVLLPCDPGTVEELPGLLTTIGRLRAGFSHPFYGAHLLINRFSLASQSPANPSLQPTIDQVRRNYGRMALLTEIPDDQAVQEAAARERPLLVDSPSSPAAAAFLSLAAEWLTQADPEDQPDGPRRPKTHRERVEQYRATMTQRIEAWLVDPSSLLYDEREAMRHEDRQALEELLRVTQPDGLETRDRRRSRRLPLIWPAAALILLAAIALFWVSSAPRRIALAAWLIGPEHYWQAGSLLLSRADELAYREIQLGTRLVGDNRERLTRCGEQAIGHAAPVPCAIQVAPP